MWTNDKIILLKDISAPPSMAGKKGDVKVVDIDIPLYYAKSAVKGGHAVSFYKLACSVRWDCPCRSIWLPSKMGE